MKDIRYACWLKRFAAQLAVYHERYELEILPIKQVQCMALSLLDLLVSLTSCATNSIQQRKLTVQLVACKKEALEAVTQLVIRVKKHPAYSTAIDDALLLHFLLRNAPSL